MFVELLTIGSSTVFLVTLVIALSIWYSTSRPSGLPPGPPLLPIIGNLYLRAWKETKYLYPILRKRYGDIFTVYYGRTLVVVLNTYDIVWEAYMKNGDVFSDRPILALRNVDGKPTGVIAASGSTWKEQRKFAITTLRTFGFGKRNIEDRIKEEISFFLKNIESKMGQAFDPRDILIPGVSNVINSIVFGERFEYDDPSMLQIWKLVDQGINTITLLLYTFFPFLIHLPGDIFGLEKLKTNIEQRRDFIHSMYKQHIETYQDEVVRDFVDAYIKKMKEEKSPESSFTEMQLIGVIQDLFEAGTETTASTLRWALLYLILNTDVQRNIQAEIDYVVGKNRLPSLTDREKMPYSQSVILEVLRISALVPTGAFHATRQDISFQGYRIPKGTRIHYDLNAIVNETFQDPHLFRPSRFLDEEGCLKNVDEVIPFSIGRRTCLGKSLAMAELFLFLTSMLQKFTFTVEDDKTLPGTNGKAGLIHKPPTFKLRAVSREL